MSGYCMWLFMTGQFCWTWDSLISVKYKFGINDWIEAFLVLEEDGTEVDEEDYFQTMKDNTILMLLLKDDIWTPYGQPAL